MVSGIRRWVSNTPRRASSYRHPRAGGDPGLHRDMTLKSLPPGQGAQHPGVHGCASQWLASASIHPRLRGADGKK
ncbi:hypothetical protein LA76x_1476 [Lysobacter antibioticus]|uniref:Uncharacterized protein n=1 Tax=Lysobacter antibioticus TaxID=84531 RepID=A0A0S2F7X4_LYSAN|nr:hypothetical protein LA76x_1476 [Lysobacter antibioticus]